MTTVLKRPRYEPWAAACVALVAACSTPPGDQGGGMPGPDRGPSEAGSSGAGARAGAPASGTAGGSGTAAPSGGRAGSQQPDPGSGAARGTGAGGGTGTPPLGRPDGGGATGAAGRGGNAGSTGTAAAPAAGSSGSSAPNGNLVEYHIPAGTGRSAWPNQSKASPIVVPLGGTLRIYNDDPTAKHSLHTNDKPCPHGPFGGIKLGGYYDCVAKVAFTTTTLGETYDHFQESDEQTVWINVTAAGAQPQGGTGAGGGNGGGTGSGPSTAVTFTELYASVFGASAQSSPSSCAGGNCHNPGKSGRMDFTSQAAAYASLSNVITPGDADGSLLIKRLAATDDFERMPKGRPALSAAALENVRNWINAGAKNN